MLSITIPEYTTPSNYELSTLPAPTITSPKGLLIRVHAASINPIDVKKASGVSKLVLKDR
jgi:NADPH:quinone reductase-like Zn-dependent oxidoreductase